MIWTIIIGVIVLGVIIGAMQISADNDSRATNALAVAKIPGYNPAVQYDGGTKKAGVSLDPTSSRFAITISGRPKVYNFSDLIAVEVVRDGQTLTKTNRGSQAVGAAVGAVLLGPVGLLMGGLSGSSRQVDKLKRLSLKIYTSDLVNPVSEICFLDMSSPVKSGGFLAKMAEKAADEWYGRFQTILHSQAR